MQKCRAQCDNLCGGISRRSQSADINEQISRKAIEIYSCRKCVKMKRIERDFQVVGCLSPLMQLRARTIRSKYKTNAGSRIQYLHLCYFLELFSLFNTSIHTMSRDSFRMNEICYKTFISNSSSELICNNTWEAYVFDDSKVDKINAMFKISNQIHQRQIWFSVIQMLN